MEPTDPRYRLVLNGAADTEELDAELRELADGLASDAAALAALGLPEAPDGFHAAVMDRVHPPRRRWSWVAVAAAVIAFVVGTTLGGTLAGRTAVSIPAPLAVDCGEQATPAADPSQVRFVYVGEPGQRVQVVGGFNAWGQRVIELEPTAVSGVYQTTVSLPPGEYEYMFLIDGDRFVSDPLAERTRSDGFGRQNAVLMI